MPYCPKCGNEVSEQDKFCSECGTELKTKAVAAETHKEPVTRKERLNRWYALISFVALEILAIIGAQPLIGETTTYRLPYLPWEGGLQPGDLYVVYHAFWDYEGAVVGLLIAGITLNLFFTRHETRRFRVATTIAVAFILLGTALGISRL